MAFEESLRKRFQEKKLSDSTITYYIASLRRLSNGKLTSLAFLKDMDAVGEKIAKYAPSTQKSMYALICASLTLEPKMSKAVKTFYHDKMMESMRAKKKEIEEGPTKTAKQEANWISWDDVRAKLRELREKATSFNGALDYLVLALYSMIPPRRNKDFLLMRVVSKATDDLDKSNNYLDVSTKKFYFNRFKTHKKYGQQVEDIPDDLFDAIKVYLGFHPDANKKIPPNGIKLLVYRDGSELTTINGITRILNRIFGKNIGATMLRHIYLTDKYGSKLKEMKEDADAMGHSTTQQREYVV